jgi:hypothetical protein
MKGIVFTEFLDLVEQHYGYDLVDKILTESHLPSGGVYTSIGTYAYSEMVDLLGHLSRYSGIPVPDLLFLYGKYFFGTILRYYAHFLEDFHSTFDLLPKIDCQIHAEVKKLYPDAELPSFDITISEQDKVEMIYHSSRKMADFAAGLLEASLEHFNEKAHITRENLEPDGSVVRFIIERHG